MYVPVIPGPSRPIAFGAAVGLLAFAVISFQFGCGAALTSKLVTCKIDALKFLPSDPQMATPYDAVDLINRLKACDAADGGAAP
jgi:hypothetical protein